MGTNPNLFPGPDIIWKSILNMAYPWGLISTGNDQEDAEIDFTLMIIFLVVILLIAIYYYYKHSMGP